MPTKAGVSPQVGTAEVIISLVSFTVLYGILAVIELRLFTRTIADGLPAVEADPEPGDADADQPLSYAF